MPHDEDARASGFLGGRIGSADRSNSRREECRDQSKGGEWSAVMRHERASVENGWHLIIDCIPGSGPSRLLAAIDARARKAPNGVVASPKNYQCPAWAPPSTCSVSPVTKP